MGLKLFDAREHDQALIEFDTANQLAPRPAALFMMAQCEYLLGRLKEARAHYERYATENPDGEFVELAQDRIQSIGKRPGTFAINTVPDEVDVRIVSDVAPTEPAVTGQAPNNFPVPRGRYRITVSKKNFVAQTRVVEIDLAETKPLFFKLDPIPAHLEIETVPPGATLYINGNRARNPYHQDITPGHVEIFAEAPDQNYLSRTEEFTLEPGQRRQLTGPSSYRLQYVQRSGRRELIAASAVISGAVGAAAVPAWIGKDFEQEKVSRFFLTAGLGVAGVVAGALTSNAVIPNYIRDNRALFIISGMWIGLGEGAGVGIALEQASYAADNPDSVCSKPVGTATTFSCRQPFGERLRGGFFGAVPGLALGLTAGAILSDKAPNYGRVALIQSAALGGVLAGALTAISLQWRPYGKYWDVTSVNADTGEPTHYDYDLMDATVPMLIGLNVGIVGGILGAYLPDQSRYGPSWQRIVLIDLATGAGALAGGISGCALSTQACLVNDPHPGGRAIAAAAALGGAVVGLAGGIFLTRDVDEGREDQARGESPVSSVTPTIIPPMNVGGVSSPPMFGAIGTF
jgi:hypothetical protein